MPFTTIICARCATMNHPAVRFCVRCALPMGTAQPDAGAGHDALGPYEAPEPDEPDLSPLLLDLVTRSRFEASPAGHGWRLLVPLPLDRQQAVYIGRAGTDNDGRSLLSLISVCAPANPRDAFVLMKLNATTSEGHFAIKLLRGEEYFVVTRTIDAELSRQLDARRLVKRIAETADNLEDRLSRGRDLY